MANWIILIASSSDLFRFCSVTFFIGSNVGPFISLPMIGFHQEMIALIFTNADKAFEILLSLCDKDPSVGFIIDGFVLFEAFDK